MLAFNLIPSTPTSDAEAYMSDDEPLFDLPTPSDTSDDEEGSSSSSIQETLAEVVNMEVCCIDCCHQYIYRWLL